MPEIINLVGGPVGGNNVFMPGLFMAEAQNANEGAAIAYEGNLTISGNFPDIFVRIPIARAGQIRLFVVNIVQNGMNPANTAAWHVKVNGLPTAQAVGPLAGGTIGVFATGGAPVAVAAGDVLSFGCDLVIGIPGAASVDWNCSVEFF